MDQTELEKLKNLIQETLKSENPKGLRIIEKVIIPFLLGLSTVILGFVSWNTNKSIGKLEESKYLLDSANFAQIQYADSISTNRSYQIDLIKLFYGDFTSTERSKRINAINLLTLMDSSLTSRITSLDWKIDQTQESAEVEQESFVSLNSYLLINLRIKIYHSEQMNNKANEMNELLKGQGAISEIAGDINDINKNVKTNQIVYYSERQVIYCKSVNSLLLDNDFGNEWLIRESSGANTRTNFIKIYFVE